MATLFPLPSPPQDLMKRNRKSCARRCERACCSVVTSLPLAIVYGLTTWAVWVAGGIGFSASSSRWITTVPSIIGIALYILLNWSYTTAVFTDPGSPLNTSGTAGYSHLPTQEPINQDAPSFTVKSTGESRYCKKCQAKKPDRAHHCSTCQRCVLRMDHHCPWLATCVGLKNYKAFLLFLIYASIYCWVCFVVTSIWLWKEVFKDAQYYDTIMPINYVLLCVISGIIGLVLTGFTIWHISLAWRGQTTIECLEKTRYLSPLRKTMKKQRFGHENGVAGQSYGQQLAEIHANALPGVTRPEEGEAILGDHNLEDHNLEERNLEEARQPRSRQQIIDDYNERERSRERERYENYLDEQDSEKLPNAFDLGWRRNLLHLFGEPVLLRFLPICNTFGDGWHWEPNPEWVEAREAIKRSRQADWRDNEAQEGDNALYNSTPSRWSANGASERHYLTTSNGVISVPGTGSRSPNKADRFLGCSGEYLDRDPDTGSRPPSMVSLKTLRQTKRGSFSEVSDVDDDANYVVSSDGDGPPHQVGKARPEDNSRKID